MNGTAPKPRNPLRLLLIAAAAAGVLWFALLFALANDDWVVLRLPTMPWNAAPSVAVFEARLFAVMLASLTLGALLASLAWWRVNARLKRRFAAEGARSKRMESELEALGRLVSTARDREPDDRVADGPNGREN
jgi:hypothetical protein